MCVRRILGSDPLLLLAAVADKGSTDRCDGEDWLVLRNAGPADAPLAGYMLTDSKGRADEDAFTFANGTVLAAEPRSITQALQASGNLCAKKDMIFDKFDKLLNKLGAESFDVKRV